MGVIDKTLDAFVGRQAGLTALAGTREAGVAGGEVGLEDREGAGHWLPDQVPGLVIPLIEHLEAHAR